jgi:hypothetical protein
VLGEIMSNKLVIDDTAVLVHLYGEVDGLDLMQVHNNPAFVDNMRKLGCVIYDYSGATDVRLSKEEIDSFARLAFFESRIIEKVTLIIIPQDPSNKERTQHYMQAVSPSGWTVLVFDTLKQAQASLPT